MLQNFIYPLSLRYYLHHQFYVLRKSFFLLDLVADLGTYLSSGGGFASSVYLVCFMLF